MGAEADGHDAVVDDVAARAFEVAPDGGFAELWVRVAEAEAGAEDAGLACGVDDYGGADDFAFAPAR